MNYLITGGTGFVGQNLILDLLQKNNCHITVLTRDIEKARRIFSSVSLDKMTIICDLNQIDNSQKIDSIINLAGEGIANKRWSQKQKQILTSSRIDISRKIIDLISRLENKPRVLISASAIGFYGNREDQIITEDTKAGNDFSAQLCQKWEAEILKGEKLGIRINIFRFGIILGRKNNKIAGALAKMLPAFRFGLGGKIGDGKQFMSWIDVEDVVSAINFSINNEEILGIFNLTAPNPVSNDQFTQILAGKLNRPAFLNMPKITIKILFGEMGESLLLSSQKISSQKLLNTGFRFKYENLEQSLARLF